MRSCLEKGLVINCTHDTVLRFVPPLIVDEQEIDQLIQILDEVLREETPMKRDLLTIRDLSARRDPSS